MRGKAAREARVRFVWVEDLIFRREMFHLFQKCIKSRFDLQLKKKKKRNLQNNDSRDFFKGPMCNI